jgi:hypothetical protein
VKLSTDSRLALNNIESEVKRVNTYSGSCMPSIIRELAHLTPSELESIKCALEDSIRAKERFILIINELIA